MGLLDELITSIEKPVEEKKEEKKLVGQFPYSKEFEEYVKKDTTAVDGTK